MNFPEWLLPVFVAVVGSGGLGAILTVLVTSRNNTFSQMQAIVKTLQDERAADRERHNSERLEDREKIASVEAKHEALDGKVNVLHGIIGAYHDWSEVLLAWGRAGGPPPEPKRPTTLRLESITATTN